MRTSLTNARIAIDPSNRPSEKAVKSAQRADWSRIAQVAVRNDPSTGAFSLSYLWGGIATGVGVFVAGIMGASAFPLLAPLLLLAAFPSVMLPASVGYLHRKMAQRRAARIAKVGNIVAYSGDSSFAALLDRVRDLLPDFGTDIRLSISDAADKIEWDYAANAAAYRTLDSLSKGEMSAEEQGEFHSAEAELTRRHRLIIGRIEQLLEKAQDAASAQALSRDTRGIIAASTGGSFRPSQAEVEVLGTLEIFKAELESIEAR